MNVADDTLAAAVVLAVLVPTVIALRLLRTVERLSGVPPLQLRRRRPSAGEGAEHPGDDG